MPSISVIIKTLNEELRIAAAIETSLAAIEPFGGEVIVADSASTDRTVEVASRYPVKIVQLKNASERCCGVAPQLGFQHSRGELLFLLDGDMELQADFVATAVGVLESQPELAGVGGFIREMQIANSEFLSRQKRAQKRKPKEGSLVECLNGGGLYRRAAIEEVGYLSDRNLHSFEEFELGARLRARGWKLMYLDRLSANHYGYTLQTYPLLWRRVVTKYVYGSGEVLRASLANRQGIEALRKLPVFRPAIGVWLYWAAIAAGAAAAPSPLASLLLLAFAICAPVLALALKDRSLAVGTYSFLAWHSVAFGFLMGFLRPRVDPRAPIDARVMAGQGREAQASGAAASGLVA